MKASLLNLLVIPIIGATFSWSPAQDVVRASYPITPGKDTSVIKEITKSDETVIKNKAVKMVANLNDLLNLIATAELEGPSEVQVMISNYLNDSRVFYDSSTLVEDDLRYFENNKLAKEKLVLDYLKYFDNYYKKSSNPSVQFMNITTSNIKKGEYLYIKVFYESLLTNKVVNSDKSYPLQKRVAELKVEKVGVRWITSIVDIHSLTSEDTTDVHKDDITIRNETTAGGTETSTDTPGTRPVVPRIKDITPEEKERLRKQNDSLRTYMAFQALIDSAKRASRLGDNITAYQFYNECETIINGSKNVISKNDVDFLQTMVNDVRSRINLTHLTPEEKYNQLIVKASAAEHERNYEEARESYNKALAIKPETAEKWNPKIKVLTSRIGNLTRLSAKFREGKYKDAINDYEKAIVSDPANSDYYVGRARCYEKTKDEKKALKDYDKAIELDATNLEAFLLRGALLEKRGNLAQALADIAVCASINKNEINYYIRMADLNLSMNNPNAAIEALNKGIQNNNNAAFLYHRKGEIVFEKLNNPALAQLEFSKAIELDSTNASSYYRRGLCEITDQKKIQLAGADFSKARKFGIDSFSYKVMRQFGADYYTKGLAQYTAGKTDGAITLLDYAVIIDPLRDEYRFQRGECYFSLKRFDEAIKNYTEAIGINPKNYQAYKQRGIAKHHKASYEEAISDLELAIKINPKLGDTYKYSGDAYFKWKKYNDAIKQYDAALAVAKSTRTELGDELLAGLYNNRGESYYQTDNYPLALENFKNAAKYNKNSGEILFNRGKTYLKLNDLDNAENDLNKALGISSTDPQWNYALGEVHQQKGKLDKAISQYNTAIGLNQSQALPVKVFHDRALCFVGLNNHADALKDYTTLRSFHAEDMFPNFNTELGNVYLQLNQPDSALAYIEKAISKNPSNAEAVYAKAVGLVEKRQIEEALPLFERAFTLTKFKRGMVNNDNRLEPVRNHKEFKKLVKKYL